LPRANEFQELSGWAQASGLPKPGQQRKAVGLPKPSEWRNLRTPGLRCEPSRRQFCQSIEPTQE
jgi:hypothetical protein